MIDQFEPYRRINAAGIEESPLEVIIDCLRQAHEIALAAEKAGDDEVKEQALRVMNIAVAHVEAAKAAKAHEDISLMYALGIEAMRLAVMTGEPSEVPEILKRVESEAVRKIARQAAEKKHATRRAVLEVAWTNYTRGNYSTLEEGAQACANHYKGFEPERDEEKRIRTFRDYFAKRSKEEGIPTRRGRPVKRTKTTGARSP